MSRGCMILMNNNFEQRVTKVKIDMNGNYIILNMELQGKELILVNLYGPNEDNPQFYKNIFKIISEFENENVIMCGDWNLVLEPEKDCRNYLHENNPKSRKLVLNFIEEENSIDIWRIMNEESKSYTWRRLNPINKQARLDFYLISNTISTFVMNTAIIPGYRTDHSGIVLKLKFQDIERVQDLGEKPSRYFLSLENRNFINKAITKLIDEDDSENSESKDILKCQQNFYEMLYSESDKIDEDSIESIIGENNMKLSDAETEKIRRGNNSKRIIRSSQEYEK